MTEVDAARRILVVDDNPEIHELMRRILMPEVSKDDDLARLEDALFDAPGVEQGPQAMNVSIGFAFQGDQAVKMVETEEPYYLAFVDMRMPPGIDGLETIKQLWARAPYLYAVICSAYSDHSWEEITRELGDSPNLFVLRKPFEPIEVRQIVAATWKMFDALAFVRDSIAALEQSMLAHQQQALVHEARARAALESIGRPALIVRDELIVAVNDAATTLLGAPARELLENPLQKYLRLDGVRAQLKGGGEIEVCITPAGGTGQTTEKLVVCNTAGTERSRQ
jgi:CheY-like chemotaxis protein